MTTTVPVHAESESLASAGDGYVMGRDTFAFANETVWHRPKGAERERFSRYCFVMTRTALQFYHFARFDQQMALDSLSRNELAERIRKVARQPLYASVKEPIVFPGACLHDLSEHDPLVFQENIGKPWTTYTRVGNWRILLPLSIAHQRSIHHKLLASVQSGTPLPLWLVNFPKLDINHAVVAYQVANMSENSTDFLVYDPNYSGAPRELKYMHATDCFHYCSTFYFTGGPAKVRILYRHAWS